MQFLPNIEAVGKLLSAPIASVSAWAHLQFIAFFCARWIWLDGLVRGVNTVHSVLLCAVLPPLGFLAHIVTTFLKRQFVGDSGGAAASEPAAAPPGSPPADSSTATPAGSDDSWATPTAGVGVAGSYSHASDGNGATAGSTAPAAAASVGSALFGRPGGRSRDAGRAGNGAAGNGAAGNGAAGNGSSPEPAAPPASPVSQEVRAKPVEASTFQEDDRSWLTVLEPVYVQRG